MWPQESKEYSFPQGACNPPRQSLCLVTSGAMEFVVFKRRFIRSVIWANHWAAALCVMCAKEDAKPGRWELVFLLPDLHNCHFLSRSTHGWPNHNSQLYQERAKSWIKRKGGKKGWIWFFISSLYCHIHHFGQIQTCSGLISMLRLISTFKHVVFQRNNS